MNQRLALKGVALPAVAALWLMEPPSRRPFTVGDFMELRKLTSVRIAPDGRRVAYLEERLDHAEDRVRTRLMLVEEGRDPVALADDAAAPAWSPDGASIAFMRPGVGGQQVFIVSPGRGRPRPLSFAPPGLVTFAWAPDSRRMAAVTVGISRRSRLQLSVLELSAERSVAIPTGDLEPEHPAWSPDGLEIAFSAGQDIYVVSLVNGRRRVLVQQDGPDTEPQWSPDGRLIAFATGRGEWGRGVSIATVPASGGAVRNYGQRFDGWFPMNPPRFWQWEPSGDRILFTGTRRMTHLLYSLTLETGEVRAVTPAQQAYWSFSLSRDGRTIAFLASDSANPGDVHVSPIAPFSPRRLTDANPQLGRVRFGPRDVVRWTSLDGLQVEGLLMKPPGYDAARRYPLVVLLEGTYGTYDLSFSARVASDDNWTFPFQPQLLAGAGYLVFMPNPRGSWGYGQAFADLALGDFADGPYSDVMAGVDALVNRGVADSARLGIAGLWLDAYRALHILTRTSRFAAAVVGQPIFDLAGWSRANDPPARALIGALPEENPALFDRISPARSAPSLDTPTFIFGTDQPPWVEEQARALRDSLGARGVPVEARAYSAEGAGLASPRALRDILRNTLSWLDRWIQRHA